MYEGILGFISLPCPVYNPGKVGIRLAFGIHGDAHNDDHQNQGDQLQHDRHDGQKRFDIDVDLLVRFPSRHKVVASKLSSRAAHAFALHVVVTTGFLEDHLARTRQLLEQLIARVQVTAQIGQGLAEFIRIAHLTQRRLHRLCGP